MRTRILAGLALVALVAAASSGVLAQSQAPLPQSPPPPEKGQDQGGFRFRAGVDLINVSATVTDASGRFVPGLHQDDFIVYEDGVPQQVTHFSAERVPVSLGLVLDTSTSMAGEKWDHAIEALTVSCWICSSRRTRYSCIASATTRCSCRTGRRTECS